MVESAAAAVKQIDRILGRITDISTLPHSMMQIIRVTNDPLSSVQDLSRIIEQDPALGARLIRCSNSVLHGLRNRVKTIHHAVSYLGFRQVRNLAVTATVCDIFKTNSQMGTYDRRRLWDHMVSVAVTSRMIAKERNVPNPEEVFLAGLLHDIGIVLEDQYMHDGFAELMRDFPTGRTLVQAEQERFGFDHTVLGAAVAKIWNLPTMVQKAIRLHHAETYYGNFGPSVACVELANVMCTAKGISSVGVPVPKLSPCVLEHLRFTRDDVKPFVKRMNQALTDSRSLFTLVTEN